MFDSFSDSYPHKRLTPKAIRLIFTPKLKPNELYLPAKFLLDPITSSLLNILFFLGSCTSKLFWPRGRSDTLSRESGQTKFCYLTS